MIKKSKNEFGSCFLRFRATVSSWLLGSDGDRMIVNRDRETNSWQCIALYKKGEDGRKDVCVCVCVGGWV